MHKDPSELTLRTLLGPHGRSFTLRGDGPHSIGRLADCDVCLLHEAVSRRHAVIVRRGGIWFVIDQGGGPGTHLNGGRLEAQKPVPVDTGDLLRIGPWTFRVVVGAATVDTFATIDDSATMARVERAATDVTSIPGRRLRLLTDCLSRLNAAGDEVALAGVALETAVKGSGYARGAFLRPAQDASDVEVVAEFSPGEPGRAAGPTRYSRSLLQAAAGGQTVVLAGSGVAAPISQSIIDMGVTDALCTPVPMGEGVAGFLYLEARGGEMRPRGDHALRAEAAGFCEAVSRTLGFALSNLRRRELELREREMHAELAAAREVQKHILPALDGDLGLVRYAAEVRAGLFVAADLFDIIALEGGRVAVCLGDVAGHGAGSALVMALTQAHLNVLLRVTPDPTSAVSHVNRFLCERMDASLFASVWVGVFEPDGDLRFVDAGHGHALAAPRGGELGAIPATGGIPIGIDPDHVYQEERLALGPGGRIVLYSDGVVEQRNAPGAQFGVERLVAAVSGLVEPKAAVSRAFQSVCSFAGRVSLDDDATVAVVDVA